MTGFFRSACFQGLLSMLQHVSVLHSFFGWLIFHCADLPHFVSKIYLSVDGYLSCLRPLPVMHDAAVSSRVCVFVWMISVPLGIYLATEPPGHIVILCNRLRSCRTVFPKRPHRLTLPPATHGISNFSTSSPTPVTVITHLSDSSLPGRGWGVSVGSSHYTSLRPYRLLAASM